MAYKLIGKDFTPPDLHAKVTGKANYSEDFRADGMVFLKNAGYPKIFNKIFSKRLINNVNTKQY